MAGRYFNSDTPQTNTTSIELCHFQNNFSEMLKYLKIFNT